MTYDIIRAVGTIMDLRLMVNERVKEGWQPIGAPFYDRDERQWCQAMTGPASNDEQIRLREPKRSK